jgi:hypothetical protein
MIFEDEWRRRALAERTSEVDIAARPLSGRRRQVISAALSVFVMRVPGLDPGIDPCTQGGRPRNNQRRRRVDARLEARQDERRRKPDSVISGRLLN